MTTSRPNEGNKDAFSEAIGALVDALVPAARQVAPILDALNAQIEPLTRGLAPAAPYMLAVAQGMERWDTAEGLLEQGWVPNHTTPFDIVTACGDDGANLQKSLLGYYTDNWDDVRARLEARASSHDVDDEAKATFREALDAHEAGLYRSVSRLLFPEFERVFRAALFNGHAGSIGYKTILEKLTGEDANLYLEDFLTTGIQDMVLFGYMTEGIRRQQASKQASHAGRPKFVPGLAVAVHDANVEQARECPIPTRHAVAHGLVPYSSRQSSLNALFIADYVFAVVSRALRSTPDSNAGDERPEA